MRIQHPGRKGKASQEEPGAKTAGQLHHDPQAANDYGSADHVNYTDDLDNVDHHVVDNNDNNDNDD